MLYASKELFHVHYHPIEAMQSGMPVVFFKDSLLGSVLGVDLAGCVKTKGQARRLIDKMLKDRLLAMSIGDQQRERVKKLEKESLGTDFADGIKEIERRKFSLKTEELRVILCSLSASPHNCAVKHFKKTILIKVSEKTFKQETSSELNFKVRQTTQEEYFGAPPKKHRLSKSVAIFSDLVFELSANINPKEIILCGSTLPGQIISHSYLIRYMDQALVKELRKEPYSKNLERLRYSLPCLERIVVLSEDDKASLCAFAPIQADLIRTQNK
jgi:hypothetical protein